MQRPCRRSLPPLRNACTLTRTGFRLLPFRSPLLGKSSLFLGVLRCFSSPRAPSYAYLFSIECPSIPSDGFPHSDISGSSLADSSPKLFAVYHVLRRPLTPRHPPYALSILTTAIVRNCSASCSVFNVLPRLQRAFASFVAWPLRPRKGLHAIRQTCGDEGTRTPALLRAREALSHLSYIPPLWAFLDLNQRPFPYQRNALAD